MKYSLKFQNGMWSVFKRSRLLASFVNRDEAMDYVDSLIEDDIWNAANRD